MTKNAIKIIAFLLIAMLVFASLTPIVFAAGTTVTASDIDASSWDDASDSSGAASSIQKIIGSIITIVQVIGTGVAIIMLIVLAIKYISAAPSDKAEIKKHAVVYVVGAIVLFAASGILGIVKNFAGNIQAA